MKVEGTLVFEKTAPKSHAFGVRTKDGVLIKVWIPKALMPKPIDEIACQLDVPFAKVSKFKFNSKKEEDAEEEDEDEDDSDEEEVDEDEDEEDVPPPRKKRKR
jgi:ribosomal protein L12E/L44/L45/RPP1/RPP2